MATHLDPFLHELEFVGREDFLRDLDIAWEKNIRIFGIFGLRAVGKTRTAFQFIRRKKAEYERQLSAENTKSETCELRTKSDTKYDSNETDIAVQARSLEIENHGLNKNNVLNQSTVNGSETGIHNTRENASGDKALNGITTHLNSLSVKNITKVSPFEVLYVDLHKFSDFGTLSSQIFAQLGTESSVRNVNELVQQLAALINKTDDKRFLLLFDNAEDGIEGRLDYSFLDIAAKLVERCKSVRIIITATTNARFAQVGKVYKMSELLPMTDIDATKLLRLLTPNVDFRDAFDKIVSLCAGLPLALMMVGAELSAGTSPMEIQQMLTECRVKALSTLSKGAKPDVKLFDEVYRKFIERLSEIFQDRLAVLSYIPSSFNVWQAQEMLGQANAAEAKTEVIIPLRARNFLQGAWANSLIERRFDIHGVIRECLSLFFEIKNMPEIRKRYCKTFVTVMKEISHEMGTREYARAVLRFSMEHPNLQQLLTDVFYSTEDTYHFYIQVVASCSGLIEKFMSSQGETFYRTCLNLALNRSKEDDMITVYIALGSMQTNAKGEFSSGFKSYQEALSLSEKFPPTQSTANVYRRLGFNMYLQGWGEDGLRYLQKSLEITSILGHQDTEDFLSTMASLGIVYSFLGRYEEAEKCHVGILRRRIALQGENHPAIGKQLNNLGILYEQKGDVDKAREYFEEGLAKKKATKTEPVSIVNSLSNVARQCADLGDFEKAENLLNEALALLEENKVNNISAIGLINNSFGKVYLKKGDFKSAVEHMKESIRIKKTTMQSESSPFFVNPLILLARGYIGCENYGAAINTLNQALALKDALIEKSPFNDLISQCYEEMLRTHSILNNEKLMQETRNEMGTELHRLINYFESKGNDTKAVHFWRKLEALG